MKQDVPVRHWIPVRVRKKKNKTERNTLCCSSSEPLGTSLHTCIQICSLIVFVSLQLKSHLYLLHHWAHLMSYDWNKDCVGPCTGVLYYHVSYIVYVICPFNHAVNTILQSEFQAFKTFIHTGNVLPWSASHWCVEFKPQHSFSASGSHLSPWIQITTTVSKVEQRPNSIHISME